LDYRAAACSFYLRSPGSFVRYRSDSAAPPLLISPFSPGISFPAPAVFWFYRFPCTTATVLPFCSVTWDCVSFTALLSTYRVYLRLRFLLRLPAFTLVSFSPPFCRSFCRFLDSAVLPAACHCACRTICVLHLPPVLHRSCRLPAGYRSPTVSAVLPYRRFHRYLPACGSGFWLPFFLPRRFRTHLHCTAPAALPAACVLRVGHLPPRFLPACHFLPAAGFVTVHRYYLPLHRSAFFHNRFWIPPPPAVLPPGFFCITWFVHLLPPARRLPAVTAFYACLPLLLPRITAAAGFCVRLPAAACGFVL